MKTKLCLDAVLEVNKAQKSCIKYIFKIKIYRD